MAHDEKLIHKILQFLKDKDAIDSYRFDIEVFDMNSIIEQLEICHKEGLISVSNKLTGVEDETIAMEGIKLTDAGKAKLESL